MTNEEFSNEFDTLIGTNVVPKSFGQGGASLEFDEYEKSLFLTKAQEDVVRALYNGTLTGESFEKTEELRRELSSLIKTYSTSDKLLKDGISVDSYFFAIPEDVWFITYEAVTSLDNRLDCLKGSTMEVVPVAQDEFHRTKENPFRRPNKKRVLRMDIENNIVELISKYTIDSYLIRYLAKPDPIVLINLSDGLSVNNISTETKCKLNPVLHRAILDMAVKLAINSRINAGK